MQFDASDIVKVREILAGRTPDMLALFDEFTEAVIETMEEAHAEFLHRRRQPESERSEPLYATGVRVRNEAGRTGRVVGVLDFDEDLGSWQYRVQPDDDARRIYVWKQGEMSLVPDAKLLVEREDGITRGTAAFVEGLKRVPYHDPYLREAYTVGPVPSNEYVDGWLRGWDDANVAQNRPYEIEPKEASPFLLGPENVEVRAKEYAKPQIRTINLGAITGDWPTVDSEDVRRGAEDPWSDEDIPLFYSLPGGRYHATDMQALGYATARHKLGEKRIKARVIEAEYVRPESADGLTPADIRVLRDVQGGELPAVAAYERGARGAPSRVEQLVQRGYLRGSGNKLSLTDSGRDVLSSAPPASRSTPIEQRSLFPAAPAAPAAPLFHAAARTKPAPAPDMALSFLLRYGYRDALHNVGHAREITAQQAEEVAWEEGYENEPLEPGHVAWGRTIGADLMREWTEGRAAASGAASASPAAPAVFVLTPGVIHEVKVGPATLVYRVDTEAHHPKLPAPAVHLSSVRVPRASRGQGAARTAVRALLDAAQRAGLRVHLLASPLDGRTSLGRLVRFYESLGFTRGPSGNPVGHPWMTWAPRPGAAASASASRSEGAWMSCDEIRPSIPLMVEQGVSEVARSPRGFLAAWRASGNRPEHLGVDTHSGQSWRARRNAFVARHMTQAKKNGEPWWTPEGNPTRRHLALVAWAYTPDRVRWRKWAGRRA